MDSNSNETSYHHVFLSKYEETIPKQTVVEREKLHRLPSCVCNGVDQTTMDQIITDTSQYHVFVPTGENTIPKLAEGENTDEGFQEVDDGDDPNEKNAVIPPPKMTDFQLAVLSNMVFMIAAAFFVAMEVTGLSFYRLYDDTPWRLREYRVRIIRWKFINETDAFPEYLCNKTNECTNRKWYNHNLRWYNHSSLDEEHLGGFLYQVPNAGSTYEINDEEGASLAMQFMLLYFFGALGFLITGMLDLYVSREFWSTVLHVFMILAASFGMMSALVVYKDEYLSIILNAISVHLFFFEALPLIASRWRPFRQKRKGPMKKQVRVQHDDDGREQLVVVTCLWIPKVFWVSLGDACFVIGAVGDVVLSYFFVLGQDHIEHAYAAIVFAVMWVLSASLYLSINLLEMVKVMKYYQDNGYHQKSGDRRKIQTILILLVAVGALVAALGTFFGLDSSSSAESDSTDVLSAESIDSGTGTESDIFTDDMLVLENCTKSMLRFSDTTIVLTMTVMSTITAIEVQHASNVLSIVYQSVLWNRFGENYCDPYCRDITEVIVVDTRVTRTNIEETYTNQSSTQCDTELYLTCSIEETYWACEDTPFPGLFSENDTDNNAVEPGMRGLMKETTCPACIDGPNSRGLIMTPSESILLETMSPFVTILPAVCEFLSIEILDTGI